MQPAEPLIAEPVALRVLLVEDDEGDAFLVQELLGEEAPSVRVRHVRTATEAAAALREPYDCVLLDLGLPDAHGLEALTAVRSAAPGVAHLVLTGDTDAHRGAQAVAAGAQDYLVKGAVDGAGLHRAIRYAVERRAADRVRQELALAQLQAQEATRLERGLLPRPLVADPSVRIGTGYRPGRERTLLGGDFLDAVEAPDGTVNLLIGDVAGHGPDEAALGVCLRIAWRTQVLGGVEPDRVLGVVQAVLEHERHDEAVFATVATAAVAPDRRSVAVRSAGHPAPILLGDGGVLPVAHGGGLPLGVLEGGAWPAATTALPARWAMLLLTDGLIEGFAAPGARDRLGIEGLCELLDGDVHRGAWDADPQPALTALLDDVQARNGDAPLDDVAALLVTGGAA